MTEPSLSEELGSLRTRNLPESSLRQLGRILDGKVQGADVERVKGVLRGTDREIQVVERPKVNSDTSAKAARLLIQLRPWIRALREKLFDQAEAPFPTEDEAKEWLSGAYDERKNLSREKQARRIELEDELEARAAELERLTGNEVEVNTERGVWLTTWKDGEGSPDRIRPRHGSPYWILAREVLHMAEFSGFDPLELTLYVLTGTRRPDLPPAELRKMQTWVPYDPGRRNTYVQIRLNWPPTYKDVRELHKHLRSSWPEEYEISPELRLLEIVVEEEIEGDPGHAPTAWEKVQKRMAEEGIEKSWRAWMNQWHRSRDEEES